MTTLETTTTALQLPPRDPPLNEAHSSPDTTDGRSTRTDTTCGCSSSGRRTTASMGFRALLLTNVVTSSMLSVPAFAGLIDASSPGAAMDLVQIIQD